MANKESYNITSSTRNLYINKETGELQELDPKNIPLDESGNPKFEFYKGIRTTDVKNIYDNESKITEDSKLRTTTYERLNLQEVIPGRKVERFKNRVVITYENHPQGIVEEIYDRQGKTTIYSDGHVELRSKKESQKQAEVESKSQSETLKIITSLSEACNKVGLDPASDLIIPNKEDYSKLSVEEIIKILEIISSKVNAVKLKQTEIKKLQDHLEELKNQQIREEEKPSEPKNQGRLEKITAFFTRKSPNTESSSQQVKVDEALQDDLRETTFQINKLQIEIEDILKENSLQTLVDTKNEVVKTAIVNQITERFLKNDSRFFTAENFNTVAGEYEKYKSEINDLILAILGKDNSIFSNSEDVDLQKLQDSLITTIKMNFDTPFGLNSLLSIGSMTEYKDLLLGDKFVKDRLDIFAKAFINSPEYGYRSDFISSPKFLKIYTKLSNSPDFPSLPNIDLGTPRINSQEIYFLINSINIGGSTLRKSEIADIIDLIPNEFNPNTEPDSKNFISFYKDILKICKNENGFYRSLRYISKLKDEAKILIEQLLKSTSNPKPEFFSEALKEADERISKTTILNSARVLLEIESRENSDISANLMNDIQIRKYFESNLIDPETKERFFVAIRERAISKSTRSFNTINSLLSSIKIPRNEIYANNYIINEVNDSIISQVEQDVINNEELSILGNPLLFTYILNGRLKDYSNRFLFSGELRSRSDLYELRRLYRYVTSNEVTNESGSGTINNSQKLENMSKLFPQGVIFKNILQDASALRNLYINIENDFPLVYQNIDKAKEIIENNTPLNRNITVEEFTSILRIAEQELMGQ